MRLHLGCGKRNIPGFVNVDLADFPHVHHRRDVADLAVFADDSADLIYASHVLEYFDREVGLEVLKEWRRVLKVGGILRLAVPDFRGLLEVYGRTARLADILGPLYGRMKGPSGYIYHKTTYDFESLQALLKDAGLKDVRRYEWRDTEHAQYDDHSQAYFPHMEKASGILVSLNVEATK